MSRQQEMFLVGNADGEVMIQCRRERCRVDSWWVHIPVPYDATPLDVDRIWHQHRVDHANK